MGRKSRITLGAFFDGRPGHEKQTNGIIAQLKKRREVDLISIEVERLRFFGQVAEVMKYSIGASKPIVASLEKCDMLLGTGAPTHLPMLFQKRVSGVPVITCMTPSAHFTNHFDLIFAPYHDNPPDKGNIFPTIGPPTLNTNCGQHDHDKTLVLIGGTDLRSHAWNNMDMMAGVRDLIKFDPGKNYIISSSPRTPKESVASLISLADEFDTVSFYNFQHTPSGWVEQHYASCQHVWVTGDSISMVYEALSSGCRVGIIPVKWRRKNSKFKMSEDDLLDKGLIVHLDAYLAGEMNWAEMAELNEAQRCAEEIIRRFL